MPKMSKAYLHFPLLSMFSHRQTTCFVLMMLTNSAVAVGDVVVFLLVEVITRIGPKGNITPYR